jgi:hypothetical protein
MTPSVTGVLVPERAMYELESAVLSAWYCSRPEIRRLCAIRDTEGLRVFVHLEPVQDSDETDPVWIANRQAWADELQRHTGMTVRLEQATGQLAGEVDVSGVLVANLSWRDPSSSIDHNQWCSHVIP